MMFVANNLRAAACHTSNAFVFRPTREIHGSSKLLGGMKNRKEQIGYLRQRGIDVLRQPDVNKVRECTISTCTSG